MGIDLLIGAGLLAQIADLLIDNIGAPDWVMIPPWRNGTTNVMFEPLDFMSYRLCYDRFWPFPAIGNIRE